MDGELLCCCDRFEMVDLHEVDERLQVGMTSCTVCEHLSSCRLRFDETWRMYGDTYAKREKRAPVGLALPEWRPFGGHMPPTGRVKPPMGSKNSRVTCDLRNFALLFI